MKIKVHQKSKLHQNHNKKPVLFVFKLYNPQVFITPKYTIVALHSAPI
jgi:hypothetical protein